MKALIYQSRFFLDKTNYLDGIEEVMTMLDSCDETLDLILTPESTDVPFAPATKEEFEETVKITTMRLLDKAAETAKRCHAFVFINASDDLGGVYANTTFAFDRNGNLAGKYLKQHLTPGEVTKLKLKSDYTYEYSEPTIIEMEGIRFAFLTCYDFYFYESFSHIAQKKPHVLIGCAQQRSDTHEAALISARYVAYSTGAYVLRAGVSLGEGSETAGSSMAVGPDGKVLCLFENEVGGKTFEFDPFQKYLKPMGYLNPVGLHHDYTEKGRRPWKYRAAGSAIVPDNRTMPYPRICAHRGFNTIAPENSMPAFGAAIALGAQEIEFDLWETIDHEIVSIHDPTLDRVSDGSGKVYEKTLAELEQLDFGCKFGEKYKGLRIVKFEDILKKFAGHVIMNTHIKCANIHEPVSEDFLKKIIALIDKYDNRRYMYFMTENDEMQKQLHRLAPDIDRCLGENNEHFRIVDRAIELGIDRVQLFKPYFTDEMIEKAKAHGIILNCFFSDDPEEASEFMDRGVDCLLTNDYLSIKNKLGM